MARHKDILIQILNKETNEEHEEIAHMSASKNYLRLHLKDIRFVLPYTEVKQFMTEGDAEK